ncbi:MAG: hypothetical protein NVS2B12_07490 [Ktedonobacteraceae bacterium]
MPGDSARVPGKGGVMGKKLTFVILSALITLFFLFMSVYELGAMFGLGPVGNDFAASQVVGWISFGFFLLSVLCLILTIRENTAAHALKKDIV